MKRQIKFRGQDRLLDWYYGVISADGKHIVKLHTDDQGTQRDLYTEVDPATIGQFTGLTDTNGKDIYEGDIVKNDKYIGVVKWMAGRCCFQISPGGVYLTKGIDVIGNVHDNHELMKGGDQ